jgi:hypothetical protein
MGKKSGKKILIAAEILGKQRFLKLDDLNS